MAREIKVKCYLSTRSNEGIEIRRFVYKDVKDPSLKQLKDRARNLYHQLRGEHFELMYIDEEDNDKVAVSSDPELTLAWTETKYSGGQFRLCIHIS
ncbi:hypothetical protein DAPPUDRAFT_323532 [Daphnia pulex]|uniref:PB1 domain-containing protein n=1 Tax=Daphnia pulex TaxID=6669 RepID=E9GZ24_DAPPU|nr:hypothetical protein DAPPUDRAFT_323532 [Daphnia pulex]|eukprot:EFX75304.1 hypothetical protein DAPPUDRAFT_323532 [Daphnia pulex]